MDKTKKSSLVAVAITLCVLSFVLISAHAKYLKEISVPETFPVVVKNSTIQYVDEVTETELETKPEPENPSSTTESTAASEGNSVSSETPTSSPSSNLDENEIS